MANFTGRGSTGNGCAGCFVPLIGLLFLAVGIYLIKDTINFLPGTVTAQGTILHCSYSKESDNRNSCSPTIQFKTQSGQPITIHPSESSSSYYEGKVVQIKYHLNTPHDGRIDSVMSTWLLPLIVAGAGLLMLLLTPLLILRGIISILLPFGLLRWMQGGNR